MAFFVEILPCIHMIRYIVTSKKIEMWYPTKIDSTRDDGLFYVGDSTPAPFSGVRLSAKETTLVFSLSFTARKAADLSQLICNKKVALAGSAPWGQFESYTFHTFRWFDGHNFSVVALLETLEKPKRIFRCTDVEAEKQKIGYPTALISAPHSAPLGTCLHLPTHPLSQNSLSICEGGMHWTCNRHQQTKTNWHGKYI